MMMLYCPLLCQIMVVWIMMLCCSVLHQIMVALWSKKRKRASSHNYDCLTHWNAADRVNARITNDHNLIQVRHVQKRCVICSSGQTDRRTNSKCMQCDVHLHDHCFQLFHSQRVLKKMFNQDEIKQASECLRKQSNRNKKLKHN